MCFSVRVPVSPALLHVSAGFFFPAVVKAFQKMKREFEFNITATATFDLEVNSSLTLQQMTQDIMAEVSSDLHRFQDLSEPLKYVGLLLLLLSFIR